jgi:hypothetical protein
MSLSPPHRMAPLDYTRGGAIHEKSGPGGEMGRWPDPTPYNGGSCDPPKRDLSNFSPAPAPDVSVRLHPGPNPLFQFLYRTCGTKTDFCKLVETDFSKLVFFRDLLSFTFIVRNIVQFLYQDGVPSWYKNWTIFRTVLVQKLNNNSHHKCKRK